MSHIKATAARADFISFVKSAGFRLTAPRLAILEAISRFKQPFTAEDLRRSLASQPRRIHRATIYRDLELLIAKGLLKELSVCGATAHFYESSQLEHHHHFYCYHCHQFTGITAKEIEQTVTRLTASLHRKGLRVTNHTFKLYGLCADCARQVSSL